MQVLIRLHGTFRVGVDDPDGLVELALPDETDIARVIDILRQSSPMLDPRACLAMIGGAVVPLDRALKDGDEVRLYPLFSGG